MNINEFGAHGVPTDRERFAGADSSGNVYATLPETPLETTVGEAMADDMAFIESVSVEWDE